VDFQAIAQIVECHRLMPIIEEVGLFYLCSSSKQASTISSQENSWRFLAKKKKKEKKK
jgi:hypothetical protein